MVNKCSVTCCRSLYAKDDVKVRLHRFPLSDPETLPLWIAATGREKDWKPCKSSRLCGNHFEKSEYIIGHGKGVLKTKSIPTIEYRTEDMEISDTNVEIVQLDYYDLNNEHQNKGNNCGNEESYYNNENVNIEDEKYIRKDKHVNFSNSESDYDNRDNSNCDEALKNEYEDFNYETNNDICNRENQCYMFTSSFKEGAEPIVLTSPDEKPSEVSLSMNIDQSIADSNFNKIMALKLKKQRRTKDIYSLYFKSLRKKNFQKQQKNLSSFNNETASFAAFIEAQMKDLRKNKQVYLTTKHKIQKILMKAQLEIAN
ncbi:rho GTPase-activating protein gacZ-like isoform X2 [Rhopalosiphum padi]|uniref:rho GTPase-activating protein gacZ-like isoform X2 n=1 Tax=Rhopalosiphum padi TaxID=40932 RepID=UPI00298DE95E|nr:rho GTPase-activating protein gacZ-like isoform X2 [Rhopalosiphum padi]